MYEYDVFISYRRGGGTLPEWVRNHFHPRLSALLEDYLGESRVFLDDKVPTGASLPSEQRDALLRSRILVPVCSPPYFHDEWCLSEWASMAERERLLGAARLIYPVVFCDSVNFPEWAHERKLRHFNELNQPDVQFQASPAYVDFHQEMKTVAVELVELIGQAPEWQSGWPVLSPRPDPPPQSRLPRF
ncbi:toll/interleukin-1 receptor domain-containing protein [Amycolatopsis bartoniae]|uniref:TIR domain-containing protein n=1 Tax=Amycolatopsis bartoniae TaxID=941986 RepID=A0A8H9IT90_9PSEU|nr:toll/interleukin-1 receptor domain-containing protein [Amycolatopsis bartoniae]GHF49838.1 hypothetical protein GCM10017566_23580 [Amycolatopsis bartoniae]